MDKKREAEILDTADDEATAAPTENSTLTIANSDDEDVKTWQENLLPFMMKMIAALAVFFLLASVTQLVYLHGAIDKRNALDKTPLSVITEESLTNSSEVVEASHFNALAQLELYTIERRYHQANMFLMSRVWVRYLGFVTGMTLALIGATFILGKMREPPSEVEAGTSVVKFAFAGASPGMFLVLAGLVLMLATMIVHYKIDVSDAAVYVVAAVNAEEEAAATVGPEEESATTLTPADIAYIESLAPPEIDEPDREGKSQETE
jgi:hypothetical protein